MLCTWYFYSTAKPFSPHFHVLTIQTEKPFDKQINRHVVALHVEAGTRNLLLAYTKKREKKVVAFFIDFPSQLERVSCWITFGTEWLQVAKEMSAQGQKLSWTETNKIRLFHEHPVNVNSRILNSNNNLLTQPEYLLRDLFVGYKTNALPSALPYGPRFLAICDQLSHQ